ncbi:hypothetical protein [Armatimonas sp.]|uniref:hypothetical protein n=1 Tax=Armatimonas sp. TaxID=1872638 RepID=UPI00286BDEC9|nr:hypothetical protein [Armatimonas sp.]
MAKPKLINNLPILNKTIAHWGKVETTLGEALTLPDSTTRDGATDLATNIQDAETALIATRNALSTAQGVRDSTRKAAHTAGKQARKSLRGLAKNTPEVLGLPELPSVTTAPATLLALYDDIANIWERVNGLPQASVPAAKLPLRIPLMEDNALVQLTQAEFVARIEALRSAAQTLAELELSVSTGIGTRDGLHKQAATITKDYGAAVRGLLPTGHPLLKTIPTLSAG